MQDKYPRDEYALLRDEYSPVLPGIISDIKIVFLLINIYSQKLTTNIHSMGSVLMTP